MGGTITRTYDNRFDTAATEVSPLGAGTSTLTYTDDAAGRRTQMQVSGQTAVTYGHDDAHRITGITQGTNVVGFTYDAASRRTLAMSYLCPTPTLARNSSEFWWGKKRQIWRGWGSTACQFRD